MATRGPKALAATLPSFARAALRKGGLAVAGLIADWPSIVGPKLAEECVPVRIAFPPGERAGGVLHVSVSGPLALELQHLESLVLERINGHFGYRAVERLKLHQDARPPARKAQKPVAAEAPLPPESRAALERVEDEELRRALARLGARVTNRT